jgi:uncharacterized protein YlxW (UPF0749 family)
VTETRTPPTDPSGRPLPPQATMGLLNYLTATSLDEDYAAASARREARDTATEGGGGPSRRPRSSAPVVLGVLAVFGLLLMTAAVQTARTEGVQQTSREALVSQIQQGRQDLADVRAQGAQLDREITAIRSAYLSASDRGRALQDQLTRLGVATGTTPVTGPGVEIVVDDGPSGSSKSVVLDRDLQILVNGLWNAGAEAVSVNGHRLTALSAIREASDAITVNYRSLQRPYTITAIGDPDQLPARFVESDGGTWWFNLKSLYDMRFDLTSKDSVRLPAVETPQLRTIEPMKGKQ